MSNMYPIYVIIGGIGSRNPSTIMIRPRTIMIPPRIRLGIRWSGRPGPTPTVPAGSSSVYPGTTSANMPNLALLLPGAPQGDGRIEGGSAACARRIGRYGGGIGPAGTERSAAVAQGSCG